jgi:hypothetical protein
LLDSTKAEIVAELALLNRLLELFDPLLTKVRTVEPDLVETAALGGILQSFYNGAENIFKRIALDVDGSLPTGGSWHSDLLDRMAQPIRNRPAVITMALQDCLWDYLEFRHVFRSAYGYLLRWEKMAHLILGCKDTLRQLETEIRGFLGEA